MYGLEAIATHNGWAMAFTGATIVFLGLVLLSATISQLYRVIDLLEKKPARRTEASAPADTTPVQTPPLSNVLDPETDLAQYRAASAPLGDSFDLAALYQAAREMDLAHPHLSISHFRQHNQLVAQPNGQFTWAE